MKAMDDAIDTVLFDLDGTLIDTAPDMVRALNELLAAEGRASFDYEQVRPHVSNGAAALLRLAFGDDVARDESDRRHHEFLQRYAADIARDSRPFPGIEALLDEIERRGMAWGVVTNKPGWLTEPLLSALDLASRAACIVSGDTLAQRKPDPAPILHACHRIPTRPQCTIYVGDAERDIAAGRAAGTRTMVALFGYIEPGGQPGSWGADALLAQPQDLWAHVPSVRRPGKAG